jgi:biotin transport system substrate-specific component
LPLCGSIAVTYSFFATREQFRIAVVNAQAATLRQAVVPRSDLLTDTLLVLGGTALVAVAAQVSIPLPFTPVPITGQTFAVVLVGASLGALRGVASLSR